MIDSQKSENNSKITQKKKQIKFDLEDEKDDKQLKKNSQNLRLNLDIINEKSTGSQFIDSSQDQNQFDQNLKEFSQNQPDQSYDKQISINQNESESNSYRKYDFKENQKRNLQKYQKQIHVVEKENPKESLDKRINQLDPIIDFNEFQFFQEGSEQQMRYFKEQFMQNTNQSVKANKSKIKSFLMQLIYAQVLQKVDEANPEDIPPLFRKNKLRFCTLIIKSPKLQAFHNEFQDSLSRLISAQIEKNKDIFRLFVNLPRQAVITEQQQKYYHIASATKNQKDPQFEEFEYLYFKSQNVQGIRKHQNRVNKELEQAKFNYKLIQKERKKRQSQLTGSLKIQRKVNIQVNSARTQKKKWFESDTESDNEKKEQEKIDEEKQGILDQIKEKLDKERKERLSKAQMNAFQQKIKKSADEINQMIQDMDQNNNELMNEVTQISHDLDSLEDEKKQKSTQKFPGEHISNMMRIWDKQIKYTDDEIQLWRDELWISLADYEQKLQIEEKGYQIIHDRLLKKYWTHYYNIKNKSNMRLTALEIAFNDSKLKYQREINRLNMIVSEYESRALNDQQQPQQKFDIKVQPIKNLLEAKLIQSQLISQIKQKETEITQLHKQFTLKNNLIESFDQRLDEKDMFIAEERRMRFYYQELIMKLVRDLKLFQNDFTKSIKIRMINENDEDVNYQRQVIALLDDIDIKQELINHVNKHFGYNQNIKNVEINLGQLGLLDQTKIDEQYQMINEKDVNIDLQNITDVADQKRKPKHSSMNLNIFQKQRNPFKNIAEVKEWQEKKKIKYQLKKDLKRLIENAVEAKLEEPVANAETGKFVQTDQSQYRQQIAKLMEDINPSALEDFRFKKDQVAEDQSPQIKKKKAEKIKKTVSKAKKQEVQDLKAADQNSQVHLNNSTKNQNESSIKKLKKNDSGKSIKKKKKTADKKLKKKDKKKSKSKKRDNDFEKSQFSKMEHINDQKSDSDQSQQQQDQEQRDMESSHRSINSRDEGSLLNQSQNRSDQNLNDNQSAIPEDQKTQQISVSSKEKLSKGQMSKKNTLQEMSNNFDGEDKNQNQNLTVDQINFQNSSQEIHIQESNANFKKVSTSQNLGKELQENSQGNIQKPFTQIEISQESQKSLNNDVNQKEQKPILTENKNQKDKTNIPLNDHRQLKIKTQTTEQNQLKIEQKKEQKEEQISQTIQPEQKHTIEGIKDQKSHFKQQEHHKPEHLQIEVEQPSSRIKTNQVSFRKQRKKEPSEQVKSFDGDPNFQEIQESILEQDEEGTKLGGVCLVANELQNLHDKKYNKILKDVQKEIDFEPKQFKMNARQITQLQEFVQATMNKKIPYDILMEDLFKAEIGQFFEKLNHQIVQNFDLENCHKILQNNGKDLYIEEKIQKLNKKELAAYNKQRLTKLKQVSFGNLFKPNFSETGELMGFEIRHELVQMMYMYNDFELSSLKRAIKACMYMNRILQMGQYMDFALRQMEGDENEEKVFQDVETQVDEFMIKVYQKENNILNDEEEEESSADSPRDSLIQILRNHGQAVMGRISKQKEAFYQLIFEDIEPEKLLNYYMEDVFDNEQSQKRNLKIQFKKYLVNILDQVTQIFRGLKDEQKQKLKINDILQLNREYGSRQYFHREVQVQPETRSIMSYTGTELLTAFTQGSDLIIKKSKNQLVLDKAMQEEFKKTLEMFDEFANQLINIESKKDNMLHQDSTEKNDQDLNQPSVQEQTLEQAIEEFKKQWIQKSTSKNIKTIKTEQSKEKMDEENQEVEENEQVVQEQEQEKHIKKLQSNIFSSIEKIKEIGGIKKKLEVVQINLNAQFKKEENEYTSNANSTQQEENMLQVYKQQNNENNNQNNQNQTSQNEPYLSHQFKSLFDRQIAKSQQVSKIDIHSLHKILSQTKYVNEEDQQIQGAQHTRDLDIHVQAHKHFNYILRQKLSNIIVKNKERAQQIDKLLNKSLDPQSVSLGYSQHFGGFSQIANELSKNNEFLGNLLSQEKQMKIKNIKQKFEQQTQQKKSIMVKGGRKSLSKENQSVQVSFDDGVSNRESPRSILQMNLKYNKSIHLEGVKARINYPPEIIVEEEDLNNQNQLDRESIMDGYKNDMQSKNDDNIIESDQRVSIKVKRKQAQNFQNTSEDEKMKAKKELNKNSFKYKLQFTDILPPQQQVFTPTDLFMDSRGSIKNQRLTNQHTLSPDLKSIEGGFDQNFRNLNTSTDVIPKSIINKALRQSLNIQKKIGRKDTSQLDQSSKNKYINLTRIQTADDKKDIDYMVNSKTRKKNIQLNAQKKYQNTLTEGFPTKREVSQSELQKRSLKVEDQRFANKTQFEMAPNIWNKERGYTAQTDQFISTSQSLNGEKLANKQSFNIYITEFEDGLPDVSKSYQSVNDKKRNGNIITNIFQQAQQTAQNRQDFEFFKQITQQKVQQQKFNKQQIKLNNQQMKEQLQNEMKTFQERLIKSKNDQQKQFNNYKQSIVLNQNSFRKNSDTDFDSLKQNLKESEKYRYKVLSSKINISDESPQGIISSREELEKTRVLKNSIISPTNVRGWSRISKQKIEDVNVKIALPDLFDDVASSTIQKNHNSSNIQDGSFQTISR